MKRPPKPGVRIIIPETVPSLYLLRVLVQMRALPPRGRGESRKDGEVEGDVGRWMGERRRTETEKF